MKDPLDNTSHAYDILGVAPSEAPEEIQAAYTRLVQSRSLKVREWAGAWQQLRRPETRFVEDFWYYPSEAPMEEPGACAGVENRFAQLILPALQCFPLPDAEEALPETISIVFSLLTHYDESPSTLLAQLEQE